jgi:hypothetical protein
MDNTISGNRVASLKWPCQEKEHYLAEVGAVPRADILVGHMSALPAILGTFAHFFLDSSAQYTKAVVFNLHCT